MKIARLAPAAACAAMLLLTGCPRERPAYEEPPRREVEGGDPARGAAALRGAPCGACHVIPGIRNARGTLAPPLTSFARRSFIGGVVANEPENLVRWIMDAPSIAPGTAMPDLPVDEATARDIAAYLYTLE